MLRPALSLGQVFATVSPLTLTVPVHFSPAAIAAGVTASSDTPAIAQIQGSVTVVNGLATLTLTTGPTPGTATLTLQAGAERHILTVRVGPPPPEQAPLILSPI